MPNPSTAAAIAPKLALIVNLPSTWNEVALSPLRKDQWPLKACGPKNDRMPGQIGRCEGDPGLVEVSSRRGEDPRPCENSPHRRCRVGKRTKPKRDVHAFGHEVFALVSHHQVDP